MKNPEEIFKEIKEENWPSLISFLHKNKKDISSDPLCLLAAKTFVCEFLRQVDKYPNDNLDIVKHLEDLWSLDKGDFFKLTPEEIKSVVSQIVKRKRHTNNLVEAYNYARHFPEETICKEVIESYEKSIPKNIEHSQSHRIIVSETKEVVNVDYRISLFKSGQEYEFFFALRKIFDTYHICPNVSISCLLNWESLKECLTQDERDYFFKGIVDVVVFDQAEEFKPIYVFELDSPFHDNKDRIQKDKIKNSIFAKAGVKIIRVRKQDKKVSEKEFVTLIRELLKFE
jgi:hypothetical protein